MLLIPLSATLFFPSQLGIEACRGRTASSRRDNRSWPLQTCQFYFSCMHIQPLGACKQHQWVNPVLDAQIIRGCPNGRCPQDRSWACRMFFFVGQPNQSPNHPAAVGVLHIPLRLHVLYLLLSTKRWKHIQVVLVRVRYSHCWAPLPSPGADTRCHRHRGIFPATF